MLPDRCLSCCLSVCPVCDVRALWPNGWTDQDGSWHAGRPRPWPLCVRWGPSSPSPKGGRSPQFSAHICCSQMAWMDQDATWYGGRPQPRRLCVRWGPRYPSQNGGRAPLPNFQPISIVVKRLQYRCKMPLGKEVGLSPGDFVLDGNPALP